MKNVQKFQDMPISEIVKALQSEDAVTVNLAELAKKLEVSVLPRNFEANKINGEKIICAFVTNERGNSCIFYSNDLFADGNSWGRIMIVLTFAKYIMTGNDNFFVTQSTGISYKEKLFAYEMLMPRAQVENVLGKLLMPTTFSLANVFQVPQEFVRYRLNEMGVKSLIGGYNF